MEFREKIEKAFVLVIFSGIFSSLHTKVEDDPSVKRVLLEVQIPKLDYERILSLITFDLKPGIITFVNSRTTMFEFRRPELSVNCSVCRVKDDIQVIAEFTTPTDPDVPLLQLVYSRTDKTLIGDAMLETPDFALFEAIMVELDRQIARVLLEN